MASSLFHGDDSAAVSTRDDARASPSPDPGNLAAKAIAKIDRGSMQGQVSGGCPKLKLVAVPSGFAVSSLVFGFSGFAVSSLRGVKPGFWF